MTCAQKSKIKNSGSLYLYVFFAFPTVQSKMLFSINVFTFEWLLVVHILVPRDLGTHVHISVNQTMIYNIITWSYHTRSHPSQLGLVSPGNWITPTQSWWQILSRNCAWGGYAKNIGPFRRPLLRPTRLLKIVLFEECSNVMQQCLWHFYLLNIQEIIDLNVRHINILN